MCGLAGILRVQTGGPALDVSVQTMADTLGHRGPDDSGTWVDRRAGVALGHTRLAILDLSQAGHQPMVSSGGRYVVAFNGEIYNYRELRTRLRSLGFAFDGGSDTEVALAAFEAWGIGSALQAFNGMFAIALWDRQEAALTLARDRMGEKPLYYGRSGGDLIFGSECNALEAHPDFDGELDRGALDHMIRYGYVKAPSSIYAGISKLPPGCLVTLRTTDRQPPEPTVYWSLAAVARREGGDRPSATEAELEALLHDAVSMRLVADVPVGAFLSGGIDSSLIAALMQANASEVVRTFAIGFEDHAFDEAPHAAAVAAHLGTRHTEFQVTGRDALALVPELPRTYDEPFGDPSQLPTMLVSQLARQHVTVALSGDGGDELFAGYRRYRWVQRLWRVLRPLPLPLRSAAARAAAAPDATTWAALQAALRSSRIPVDPRLPERVAKAANALGATSARDMHMRMMSPWPRSVELVPGGGARTETTAVDGLSDLESMLMDDGLGYLPDDILVKVDRASMRVGLECRVPLLDHRVVEHAWAMAPETKLTGSVGKAPLRAILRRYVPDHLTDRPKQGFDVPLAAWLRGPLKEWADDLLAPGRLGGQGYLEPAAVTARWQEHTSKTRDHHLALWHVLMFQSWLDARPGGRGSQTSKDARCEHL